MKPIFVVALIVATMMIILPAMASTPPATPTIAQITLDPIMPGVAASFWLQSSDPDGGTFQFVTTWGGQNSMNIYYPNTYFGYSTDAYNIYSPFSGWAYSPWTGTFYSGYYNPWSTNHWSIWGY